MMFEVIEVGRLRKNEYAALEKVFAAEIEGRLPLQSKNKVYLKLESYGYVEKATRDFPADRLCPISVTGWVLTHAGRLTYCMNC